LQEQHGDFEKAAATYETLHKQNPQSSRAMFKLARLYALRLNQPEKAMVLATAAHKLAPDSPDVSAILGHLVFHSGDYTWSLSLLENAALERPNDPQLLYDLAWAQYSSGRVADAQTTLQKALKAGATKSDDAQQFLDLADAFMTVPKAQAASAQAQKVLQTNAKYVPALMVTGAANESAGNFTAAQSDFSKALDVFPQFAPAQRRLAILDAQHFKNDARGYAMAEKALTAYPDDTEVADSLGILGFYQAKYSRSAEVLQESISNGKSDGELYYCLGMDYYHLRKSKESKQSLQRALDLNLPDKLAVEARHTLSELK
jgi:Flp pilus assembly protein TadD